MTFPRNKVKVLTPQAIPNPDALVNVCFTNFFLQEDCHKLHGVCFPYPPLNHVQAKTLGAELCITEIGCRRLLQATAN